MNPLELAKAADVYYRAAAWWWVACLTGGKR